MTEYWKSYAKKFCDVCKCWITDNKASIQFHEGGKRHKENVGKKINELVKKATKDGKEKKQLDSDFKKMEEAALKAYMKDVEENPDYSSQYVKERLEASAVQEERSTHSKGAKSAEKGNKIKTEKIRTTISEEEIISKQDTSDYVSGISAERVWYEAKSEKGDTYYWNITSNESAWEPPEDYVSLDEQAKEEERKKAAEKKKAEAEEARKNPAKDAENSEELRAAMEREKMRQIYGTKREVDEEEEASPSMGPQARTDPYGSWTTVVKKEVKPVDLQLPPQYIPPPQPSSYFNSEPPRVKIKEKILDTSKLDISGVSSSFKKRKISHKGNVRQRFDDDD